MPSSLKALHDYQHELTMMLPDDGPIVIRHGLIASFYFLDGASKQGREAIVRCFDRYFELFKDQIKGKVFGETKLTRTKEKDYEKWRTKALALEPNDRFSWELTSVETEEESPQYYIYALSSQELLRDKYGETSFLKFAVPWQLLESSEGQHLFHQLVLYVANQINAAHGYAGLSTVLPYAYDRYMPNEFDFAQRFSGLMVDSMGFADGLKLKTDYIKGVNWYTILGHPFVERLGGETTLLDQLNLPEVTVEQYDHGLLIRAGEFPSLGAPEDGLPGPYVVVNRVLKRLRHPEPEQLQTYMTHDRCFDLERSLQWYNRFDDTLPLVANTEAALHLRCLPGELVPKTGWWWTPALSETDGSRHFQEGERFPDVAQTDYGDVIWNFAQE